MDINESLTARLWLEHHKGDNTRAANKTLHVKYAINQDLQEKIKRYCKKSHVSWEMVALSAFGILINRFSSTDIVCYGTGSAAASRTNAIRILNQIISLKSQIDSKATLRHHLSQLKKQLKNHKPTKSTNHDTPRYLLLLKSKSTKKSPAIDPKQYPLIIMCDKKNPASITIYHSNIFSKEEISHLIQHFEIIINEFCQDDKQIAATINLLTDNEKISILQKWYKTEIKASIVTANQSIPEMFDEVAQKYPNNLAINHNTTEMTYRELDLASTALAKQLIAAGVFPGAHVCVLLDRTPALIVTMLAIFKTGGIYIPLNPKYPHERIHYILEDAKPVIIITNNTELISTSLQCKILYAKDDNLDSVILKKTPEIQLPKVGADQIAYIIYTSGTTGTPKGVMVKHKSLANLTPTYQQLFNLTCNDRASQFASQAFDTYLCETIPYLTIGASVHIVDDNIKLTPDLFFDWLVQQRITMLDLATSYALMLFALPWPKKVNLRMIKIGGENVTSFPNQQFPFDIWNGYGPTEAAIESTFMKIYEANTAPENNKSFITPPIGKPIINCEVYIVDKYLQPVPVGVGGELLIGGINLSVGYLNREELTEKKFIPHLFKTDSSEKLYRTGDLARWLPDGNIEFIGRIDHQVKIRGYRVELGEIESTLSKHPDVNEAVVISKENLNGDKSLIAYVTPNLDKERYLYQERCLLSINNKYIEAVSEDISKNGVAISGITDTLNSGDHAQIHIKLPGFNESKILNCIVIWQEQNRCGLKFNLSNKDQEIVEKSIEYYLSIHNVMELVLSASAKRSLRRALKKKLPDYMIPSTFVTMMQFPLTFSGKVDLKALPPPQEFENNLRKEFIEPETNTEKTLADIWRSILNIEKISMSDNFFDLGGSSLTAAELSIAILNKFHLSIPTKLLFDLAYIPILAEYIDSNGKTYTKQSFIQDEISSDSKLPGNLTPVKKITPNIKHPLNILLTGAGGFLGIFLLKELLEKTDAKIYCLIRSGEFESAAKKLHNTIHKYKLSPYLSLTERRIIAIASDISFDHFGLPKEQYQHLISKVDLIYHCGAQVNVMAAYNKLRGSNVLGTLEVIKFASQKQKKPIHYISTLSAACIDPITGTLTETFPPETCDELFGGYAISKWVSERLLAQLHDRGHPVSIYRSGYIAGTSDGGMTNLNDALLMLIKGCIQLGYAPNMFDKITILPVDFVSRAVVTLSLKAGSTSGVYHIDHPTGIMWTDLVGWMNHYGYSVKLIPMKQWQKMLLSINKNNVLYPFLPHYLTLPENYHSIETDVSKTSALLKKYQINYPDINDNMLTLYFDHLCQAGFLPTPEHLQNSVKIKDQEDS